MKYFFALLLFSNTLLAQVKQDIRIEYDTDDVEDFDVITMESTQSAIVKYQKKSENSKSENSYTFDQLNSNLQKVKSLNVRYQTKGFWANTPSLTDKEFHYLLNFNQKKGTFIIHKINLENLTFQSISGNFGGKFVYYQWRVNGDKAYVSCRVKKKLKAIVIDLNTGIINSVDLKTTTNLNTRFIEIQKVKTPVGSETFFRYEADISKKNKQECFIRFNENGEMINKLLFIPKIDDETFLIDPTFTKLKDGDYAVTGAFGKKRRYVANGIFFGKLSGDKFVTLKYYNFLDIKNFTKYVWMSDKSLEKKQEKAQEKGEEFYLNYLVLTHDIIELNGQYVYVGEFYYRTYRTETYTTTDANGRVVTRTRQVFDGFQYSHGMLAVFNQDGSMMWSDAFSMWVANKPFYAKEFIKVVNDSKSIKLLYATGSTINSMSYSLKGDIISTKTKDVINTNNSGDKLKYTFEDDLIYWYDNNFITYGFQKIKNEEVKEGKKKRKVYYINKLSF